MVELVLLILLVSLFFGALVINSIRKNIEIQEAKSQNLNPIYNGDWSIFCPKSNSEYKWTVEGWFCYRFRKHKYAVSSINPKAVMQLNGFTREGLLDVYAVIYRNKDLGRGITLVLPKTSSHLSDVPYSRSYFDKVLVAGKSYSFDSVESAINYAEQHFKILDEKTFPRPRWSLWENENTRPWSDFCLQVNEENYWTDDPSSWFFLRFRQDGLFIRPIIQLNGKHDTRTDALGKTTYIPTYAAIYGDIHGKDVTLIMPRGVKYLFGATDNRHTGTKNLRESATFTQYKTIEEAVKHAESTYSEENKFLADANRDYREVGYHSGAVGTGSDCS